MAIIKKKSSEPAEIIRIELGARSYMVIVREGLFADGTWAEAVAEMNAAGERMIVVSDETVWKQYGHLFDSHIWAKACPKWPTIGSVTTFAAGEENKTLATAEQLYEAFASAGIRRGGLVVALGGGVVGDLAGFAAATWMRGVRFVQLPTTLLAMVDSSVGGKTGVDVPAGKNLVGAFHQPSLVLCDPAFLKTLPEREVRSGMSEVVKTGLIASEALFGRVVNAKSADASLIADCIRFKAEIVGGDERESGRRKILNFGHTFGHAIEVKYGFVKYTHGEAVAAGMRIAAALGERIGVTERGTASRVDAALSAHGLLVEEPTEGLLDYIRGDKKSRMGGIDLVLLKRVGLPEVVPVTFAELESALAGLGPGA
jgi:3-dehydroquinate synthase